MNILIIGGTGNAGSRIAQEALDRDHSVTLASRHGGTTPELRSERVTSLVLDSADSQEVTAVARDHDLIISATRPAVGRGEDIVAATHGLATGAREAQTRLLVVGGAGPLLVPGSGRLALDDPQWVPSEIRPIAAMSSRQLEILREYPDTDWTYVAPAAHFAPGRKTARYATSRNELVIGSDGSSMISMEDYSIGLIDMAEVPGEPRRVVAVGSAD